MRIALGQLLSTYDPQQNLERVADLARRGEDGADAGRAASSWDAGHTCVVVPTLGPWDPA